MRIIGAFFCCVLLIIAILFLGYMRYDGQINENSQTVIVSE